MKKILALMLAVALALSLVACGGGGTGDNTPSGGGDVTSTDTPSGGGTEETTESDNPAEEPETPKYSLGETVSTDIVDFSLDNVDLTIFASATVDDGYLLPTEEETIYGASVGRTLAVVSFSISNKDRSGKLDVGGTFSDWSFMNWVVSYNGEEYQIRGFDLNDKDGSLYGINLSQAAIVDRESGRLIKKNGTNSVLVGAGDTISFRAIGIIGMEPESLKDEFELTVDVPISSGEKESFTYSVPAR